MKLEGFKEDPEIDYRHLNTALHGDLVRIVLHPKRAGYRQTAEVAQILARAKPGFSGVLEEENGIFSVRPDDGKMYVNIFIPAEKLAGAKPGQKVFAEIISWKDSGKPPEGKITKVFGRPGSNDAEMLAIAMEKGFEEAPSARAENEADKIRAKGITEADLSGRRDFREILTFTIDPADAKDFDDA
ncbi:MAG TPA: ribonuclease R, partial [Candidatus Paceibacterota bacterium]|nr:ribonuclease R [Candidatus Paceibacterota bacterium]